MNKTEKKHQNFEEFIKQIEDPSSDYPWVAKDLPENPTVLEKTKFEFCQKILAYQQDNNLSDEEVSQQLQLTKKKTLKLLFCWIDSFTLDELVNYASKLFEPLEVGIIKAKSRTIHP